MDDEQEPDEFPDLDELIGSFMGEASLWPVLIVAVGSAGAFGAAMLVLVGIDHNPFAAAALLLILGLSIDIFVQSRRKAIYRNIAKLIGVIWCVSIAMALLAIFTGIAL